MADKEVMPTLAPVLTGRIKARYIVAVLLWGFASFIFWEWWLRPEHIDGVWRYGVVTALIGWVFLLQVWFLFFLMRAHRCVAPDPVPGQFRVAMIVTKTPSEPFDVVRATLLAMLAQDYPHDTWLADEDPAPATEAWCAAHGVRISTRKGRADYHRGDWPRRTRCKEGNLAFFYDHWGYAEYDIVSQLDCDHVPQPGYLREMLRPFADPAVGYVSAPSICNANATANWAARTRLHTEAAFHGALQSGYSKGFAPMCIGSHYAVRTVALQSVGGLGPDLAEDHSTSLLLNAGGWRGVHAIDAIATGDGPATVADMVTQEFQWSRSLVTLLLTLTPGLLHRLPFRLGFQFLFCQLLYPAFAVTLSAMYLLPVVAVVFDIRYADVTYPQYLAHAAAPVGMLLVIAAMIRRDGLFRPHDAKIIGWEKVMFVILQWPWVLWGCAMAIRDVVTGRFVDFRITPKGDTAQRRLPLKMLIVYAALSLGCIVPVIVVYPVENAQGFYLLTLFNGGFYALAVIITVIRHLTENGGHFIGRLQDGLAQWGIVTSLVLLMGTALSLRSAESLHALSIGLEPLHLVEPVYHAAGAGQGAIGKVAYQFRFGWQP
jgi:cellulose synthase (UDP-forming)